MTFRNASPLMGYRVWVLCVGLLFAPVVSSAQTADSDRAREKMDSLSHVLRCMRALGAARAEGRLFSPMAPLATRCKELASGDSAQRVVVPVLVATAGAFAPPATANNVCPMPVFVDRVNIGHGPVPRGVIDSVAANPPGNVAAMPTSRHPCLNALAR